MLRKSLILTVINEKADVICDFVKRTAMSLAKNGSFVFVINIANSLSIKEVFFSNKKKSWQFIREYNGFYQVSPLLILPLRRIEWIYKLNLKLSIIFIYLFAIIRYKLFKFRKIAWLFFPRVSVNLLSIFKFLRFHLHFDVVDFYTSPDKNMSREIYLAKKKILQQADTVSVISHVLEDKYSEIYQREMRVVPQGFSIQPFKNYYKLDVKKNKPIIGFIGSIGSRLDFNLLEELVKRNKQWQFLFIGPKTIEPVVTSSNKVDPRIDELFFYDNVTWINSLPKKYMATLVNFFDVAMIPYDLQYDFNKYCFPMKFFEYLYMKKSIVSTPIEEFKRYEGSLYLAGTVDEWEKAIKQSLKKKKTKDELEDLRNLALEHTWDKKVEVISEIIVG